MTTKVEEKERADTSEKSPEKGPQRFDILPAWLGDSLHSRKSWKLVFRCWFASWVSFVILLPHSSLKELGNAGFFALLASFFLPPYLPVQLFFIVISTLMVGVLSGWGLGIAAMRAANAARSKELIASVTMQIEKSIASNPAASANPTAALADAIFHGDFLDTRASAIYGCFLGVGAFVFGLIRAYSPKLLFMSIFGTIALDIFCSTGPLFPTAEYTILKTVAISLSCYMAIALLVTIFVFPQTMNHLCMDMISAQLGRLKALIEIQQEVLDAPPMELAPGTKLINTITAQRAGLVGGQRQLTSTSGTINLEFSVGKWNGDDVRDMEEPLLALVVRVAGLQSFSKLVGDISCSAFEEANKSTDSTTTTSTTSSTSDSYLLRQLYQRNVAAEQAHNVTITDVLPALRDATHELRDACITALSAAQATIDFVNTRRWKRPSAADEENTQALTSSLTSLREALANFKDTHRKRIVTPYLPLLLAAQSGKEKEALPLKTLYVSFVFAANLIVVSDGIVDFMETIRGKVEKRAKNRLWAPKGLRAIGKFVFARGDEGNAAFGEDTSRGVDEDVSPEASEDYEREELYRRDPDSKPPTNIVQRLMDRLHKLWIWARTAEALFTFKYVILTIALWLPAVVKSSAYFYYAQKGVWALIMAQTTLNIYAADQIFNLFSRLLGTILGLVFGLVAWFIGNGRGNGSPYGAAAAMGVLIIPIMFVRVHVPQQYLTGVVLGAATFALIMGYSWVDGHYTQVAPPGIGWPVAWKRWVLVVIGSAASFIIMMIPPTSSRKAVRLRNASSLTGLSSVYTFLIATWISASPSSSKDTPNPRWLLGFRSKLLALGQEIQTIRGLTELARWEGSVRGAWPADEYRRLVDVQSGMIASLAQLGGAIGHLEDDWRLTFLHSTKVLNPYFISDVMSMFALVSHTLRTGEPTHQVFPTTLLDRLFYHQHHRDIVLPPSAENKSRHYPDADEIQSLNYMYYAQGVVAVYQLLRSLDELHKIVKTLCGEVPLAGFTNWRDEYQRRHMNV